MKIFCFAFALVVLLITGSCRSPKPGYAGDSFKVGRSDFLTITVPVKPEDDFNVESLFDSVSFIRLSSDKEAFVAAIDQIQFSDSLLFVRDTHGTGTVKAFRMDGEYSHLMGRKGRGPGEYLEPTYMEVTGDELAVYDQFNQEMFFYGFDGKYKRSKKFPFMFMQFHIFGNDNYLIHTINSDNDKYKTIAGYDLFFCDSLDNVTKRGFYRKKDSYESTIADHKLFARDDVLYYHPIYNDTIYSVTADGIARVEYAIDFGRKTVPEKFRNGGDRSELREEESGTRYNFMGGNFFIVDSVLNFSYANSHRGVECFYYPATGQVVSFRSRHGFFPLILFGFVGATDEAFVSALPPSAVFGNVRSYRESTPYEDMVKKLGKARADLVMDMDANDNPIIVFYYPGKSASTH